MTTREQKTVIYATPVTVFGVEVHKLSEKKV